MTKHYEQHICAELHTIKKQIVSQKDKLRGEMVLILHGNDSQEDKAEIEKAMKLLVDLQQHMSLKDAVAIVAKHTGVRRNQLYSQVLKDNSNNQ